MYVCVTLQAAYAYIHIRNSEGDRIPQIPAGLNKVMKYTATNRFKKYY
jgi:hypothetical protein